MASEPRGGEAGEAGDRTILVVDDEADLLEAIRRVLTRRGHTVLPAGDVTEAMQICRAHPGPIDLLLTDLRMPGGSGQDLAYQAREQRPGLPVLFMSGLADSSGLASGQVDGPVVGKPFTPHSLTEAVEAALSAQRT